MMDAMGRQRPRPRHAADLARSRAFVVCLLCLGCGPGVRFHPATASLWNSTSSAACTAALLRDLAASTDTCAESNATARMQSAQDAVDRYLVQCLNTTTSGLRPINILLVQQYEGVSTMVLRSLFQQYGWEARTSVLSSMELSNEIADAARSNLTSLYDLVIYSNKYLPDFGRLGLFADLTPWVASDERVDWVDVVQYYRDSAAYGGKLVGLPLLGVTYSLFYRRDILHEAGYQEEPHTWEDLVTLADKFNGTDFNGDGVPDHSVCHVLTKYCQAPHILLDIATNILQYQGPEQGCLFDPETMEPLVDNPGFAGAMDIYRRLAAFNAVYMANISEANPGCLSGIYSFLNGTCMFLVSNSQVFKGTKKAPWLMGKVGAAMVPGVTKVWERASQQLQTCTPTLCPFAVQRTLLNGDTAWVNYAPWKGTVGYSGSVAASISPDYQSAAFAYLAIATSPNITWAGVLDQDSINAPLRKSMISGSGAARRFIDAGYNANDTVEWLSTTEETLGSGNAVIAHGLPEPDWYQQVYEAAAMNLTYMEQPGGSRAAGGWNTSIPLIQRMLLQGLKAQMKSQAPIATLRSFYWASIGRGVPSDSGTPSTPASTGDGGGGGRISGPVLAAVIVPIVVGLGAIVALSFMLSQLQRARRRSLIGKIKPPGVGPTTTLLITDIEGSTTLFEDLEPLIMDKAISIHHETVRTLCQRHNGYEWSTEGDSFLLAFHVPTEAIMFAADVQVALMSSSWPVELLEHPLAAPLWVLPVAPGPGGGDGGGRRRGGTFVPWPGSSRTIPEHSSSTGSSGGGGGSFLGLGAVHAALFLQGGDGGAPKSGGGGGGSRAPSIAHMPSFAAPMPLPSSSAPGPTPIVSLLSTASNASSMPAPRGRTSMDFASTLQMLGFTRSGAGESHTVSMGREAPERLGSRVGDAPSMTTNALFVVSEGNGASAGATAPSKPPRAAPTLDVSPDLRPAGAGAGLSGLPKAGSLQRPRGPPSPFLGLPRYHSARSDGLENGLAHAESPTANGNCAGPHAAQLPHHGGLMRSPAEPLASGESGEIADDVVRMTRQDGEGPQSSWTGETLPPAALHPQGRLDEHRAMSGANISRALNSVPLAPGGSEHNTILDQLTASAVVVPAPHTGTVFLFCGLRVRIGMHSGIESDSDITFNSSAGRTQYGGPPLAMARAVQGAACGGMTLMSESTSKLVPVESLRGKLIIGHEGEHLLPEATHNHFPMLPKVLLCPPEKEHLADHVPVNLYSVLPHGLVHRAALMATRIRSLHCLKPSWQAAPFGRAAVCFMQVAGAASLQDWNPEVTDESLALFRAIASRALTAMGGYLVESTGGQLLVAFPHSSQAIRWALGVIADCLEAAWPAPLLDHELGEEVAVQSPMIMGPMPSMRTLRRASISGAIGMPPPSPWMQLPGLARAASTNGRRGSNVAMPSSPPTPPGPGMQSLSNPVGTVSANGRRGSALGIQPPALLATDMLWPLEPPPAPTPTTPRLGMASRASQAWRRRSSVHLTEAFDPVSGQLMTRTLLFRGLRIKCGIDFGSVACELHPTTGRATYRGRCMNRASRITGVAKTGQVWASAEAWQDAEGSINSMDAGFGLDAAALASLQARVALAAAGHSPVAVQAVLEAAHAAGHTEHEVLVTELAPQRLKGITEELALVAVAFSQVEGMGVLALKDTVQPGLRASLRSTSLRHLTALSGI